MSTYIRFGTLKVKCTHQYEFCGQVAFKNARAMIFSKSDGQQYSVNTKNQDFLEGRLPLPEYSTPEKFLGRGALNIVQCPPNLDAIINASLAGRHA